MSKNCKDCKKCIWYIQCGEDKPCPHYETDSDLKNFSIRIDRERFKKDFEEYQNGWDR